MEILRKKSGGKQHHAESGGWESSTTQKEEGEPRLTVLHVTLPQIEKKEG